jgi:hypothetical protein
MPLTAAWFLKRLLMLMFIAGWALLESADERNVWALKRPQVQRYVRCSALARRPAVSAAPLSHPCAKGFGCGVAPARVDRLTCTRAAKSVDSVLKADLGKAARSSLVPSQALTKTKNRAETDSVTLFSGQFVRSFLDAVCRADYPHSLVHCLCELTG